MADDDAARRAQEILEEQRRENERKAKNAKAKYVYDDLVVDSGKLRALGWSPRFPRFAEGWREVLRWYQAERWVPRYA